MRCSDVPTLRSSFSSNPITKSNAYEISMSSASSVKGWLDGWMDERTDGVSEIYAEIWANPAARAAEVAQIVKSRQHWFGARFTARRYAVRAETPITLPGSSLVPVTLLLRFSQSRLSSRGGRRAGWWGGELNKWQVRYEPFQRGT